MTMDEYHRSVLALMAEIDAKPILPTRSHVVKLKYFYFIYFFDFKNFRAWFFFRTAHANYLYRQRLSAHFAIPFALLSFAVGVACFVSRLSTLICGLLPWDTLTFVCMYRFMHLPHLLTHMLWVDTSKIQLVSDHWNVCIAFRRRAHVDLTREFMRCENEECVPRDTIDPDELAASISNQSRAHIESILPQIDQITQRTQFTFRSCDPPRPVSQRIFICIRLKSFILN